MTMSSSSPTSSPATAAPVRRGLIIAVTGVIVLGGGIWMFAAMMRDEMPRLNENAVVLTKFVGSRRFEELPFEQQRQFYKVLDDRDDELDAAFASKRLTESEYRLGLEAAWLGKHLNRVEKYFALPPGQARTAYIAKLLEKRERKRAKPDDPDSIDADETAAELRVENWPSPIRTQWKTFHDTYRAERKARERATSPQLKPSS